MLTQLDSDTVHLFSFGRGERTSLTSGWYGWRGDGQVPGVNNEASKVDQADRRRLAAAERLALAQQRQDWRGQVQAATTAATGLVLCFPFSEATPRCFLPLLL